MSIADKLGLGPTRRVMKEGNQFRVYVKPPEWAGGGPEQSVLLTEHQYQKYQDWQASGKLVQEVFPELLSSDREILMSGL